MNINIKDDFWMIPCENISYTNYYNFDFTPIKSPLFRQHIKVVLFEMFKADSIAASSIHRYYSSIKNAFLPFLEERKIEINYFSEISYDITLQYIFYLKSRKNYSAMSNSTSLAGIKSIINYGIMFRLSNYPKFNPFPTKTSRIFGTDDIPKTRYISDEQIEKIRIALGKEENIYLKAVTTIADQTGIRLSEILTIRYDCLLDDFDGFPILYTYSIKGVDERYLTASREVIMVIEQLREIYLENPEGYLFFKHKQGRPSSLLQQSGVRSMLERFCIVNDIDHHTFHAYRHTVGTTMLNNGATGSQIQNQLGHASFHSTNLYAKVKNKTVEQEYYRMPILGLDFETIIDEMPCVTDSFSLSLPDGCCKNMLMNNQICEDSYKCLFCNLYRTFKDDLPTHKSHLERIRKDAEKYMMEEGVNSFELLNDVVFALEIIIERLESK